jgi:AraC-like DNA-binding protein
MLLLSLGATKLNFGPFFGLVYGPIFYIYTNAMIYADQQFRKKELIHFAPALVLLPLVPFLGDLLDSHIFGIIITSVIIIQMSIYLFMAYSKVMWFQRNIQNFMSEVVTINLSWLKFLILSVASLFVIVLVESLVSQNVTLDNITIVVLYLFVLLFLNAIYLKGLRQPEVFQGITAASIRLTKDIETKYKSSKLTKEESDTHADLLKDLMAREKPFLEYELSLEDLATKTDIPQRYLSQVVNEHFEKNFFDFVNSFRIEEAKRLLSDRTLDLRISEVMYDSGFNSKSTFNAVFKKNIGMTPSEFRKSAN